MKRTLIVPLAADHPTYEHTIPYLFRLNRQGFMTCVSAIMGLDLDSFDQIYFTVLQKHVERYMLNEMFDVQFRRARITPKAKVLALSQPTHSQCETVYRTIVDGDVEGLVFVKDADSYFEAKVPCENSVCVYPLDYMDEVNPQDKSYVNIDDMYYITNIIEKRIIGRDFCAGGYVYEDARQYVQNYERLQDCSPLYMSHLIFADLLDGEHYRPIMVKNYQDWGTEKQWIRKEL